jgi:hypothetical protein
MTTPAKPVVDEETPLEVGAEYANTVVEDDDLPITPKPKAGVATAAKPVEKPVLSPRMKRMCADLGIEDDEIDGLPVESVEVIISREIRRQKADAVRNARAENETDRRKAEKVEEELEWGEFVDVDGVKRKATDEDVHGAILSPLKKMAKEIKELKAQLAGTSQGVAKSNQEKFEAAFDASCSRFKKTLGEGSYSDLKGTPFTKKREVVFREVIAMIQANPQIKMDDAIEKAVEGVYGVKLKKPEAKPVVVESDEEDDPAAVARGNYTAGKTARPSGRKGKPGKGVKGAEDAVEAWLADNLPDTQDDDDDDSEY